MGLSFAYIFFQRVVEKMTDRLQSQTNFGTNKHDARIKIIACGYDTHLMSFVRALKNN